MPRCHEAKSGLDLSSLQTMLRGGERGAAVVPGRPDDSNLYKFLRAEADPHMPPGKRAPLSNEEVALIAKWIQELPVVKVAQNSGATNTSPPSAHSTNAQPRIAWKPDARMAPEKVADRFLELAWKLDKVSPARLADDRTFVRRLYLDLIGRIPTTNEVREFVNDRSRDKRARVVDKLLSSDEYALHMREVFDTVLMGRPTRQWEERRANGKWFAFLDDAFRRNRPWNEVVRDMVVGQARARGRSRRGVVPLRAGQQSSGDGGSARAGCVRVADQMRAMSRPHDRARNQTGALLGHGRGVQSQQERGHARRSGPFRVSHWRVRQLCQSEKGIAARSPHVLQWSQRR
jgi:hypothetical protein